MTPQLEASNLVTPVINAFKVLSNEWNEFFEIGLASYLYSQANKYYFTNTFIHRNEKVKFDEIYHPIKASYKKLTTDFSSLEDILDEYKAITIIGSAGGGKTTLIKYIFLRAIELKSRIPILIELRNLNEYDGDFEKLISEKVLNSRIKPSDDIFKRTLKSGNFLFLLDGYDEIFSTKKQETNRQIEFFIDAYPENRFILTTRPGSGIENFARFYNFSVCALSDEDVVNFIRRIVHSEERRKRIEGIVEDPKNGNYIEFLRNPLLLSMFILAFENHPEIPGRKSAFYRNVFDTLYSRHDGITKNSFPREKLTKLQRDDFEFILSVFSYLTLIEGQYSFTREYLFDIMQKVKYFVKLDFQTDDLIYDLHTSISILVLDGFEYSFPHRSMQEYFTAIFISKLHSAKKEKVYHNLSKILRDSSADNSFNFWSLCSELDEVSFNSYFVIPSLKSLHSTLDSENQSDLLSSYTQMVGASLIETKAHSGYRLYNTAGFEYSFLDFCASYNYGAVWNFPEVAHCQASLREIAESENLRQNQRLELSNPKVSKLLIEKGFINNILSLKTNIDKKIKELEEEIVSKNDSVDDLLSLQ